MKRSILVALAILVGAAATAALCAASPQEAETPEGTDKHKLSYGVGFYLGQDIRDGLERDGVEADLDLLVRGFADGLKDLPPMMEEDELEKVLFAVHKEMQRRMVKRLLVDDPDFKRLHDDNLRRSRAYHERHKYDKDVITLDNGIQYRVIKKGHGASPTLDDIVVANIKVWLIDGTVIDEGQGVEVEVDSLNEGGMIVLQMMQVGDKWHVAVPPELAYGAAGDPPNVGPNQSLIAEVELLDVKREG